MKPTLKRITGIGLILFCLQSSYAQYDGERVMEKSFEQTDFYFTPYRFVPFGIGAFKNSVPGALNDPFLDLDVNPARLYRDTSGAGYLTIDFRNARQVAENRDIYFPYPMLRTATTDVAYRMPYPQYYLRSRRELEPAVSLAYLLRPRSEGLNAFSFGATYQLITQDERYYSIPQDIYKSMLGADYSGDRAAGTENIPIVDKYSGSDEMHQEGHFGSLFTGIDLTTKLQFGVKVGRVVFEREGSFGSNNFWEYGSASSTSLWRRQESRRQTYGHWEAMAGLRYAIDDATTLGISGGLLTGTADQTLPKLDSTYYAYGPIDAPNDNWGLYASSGMQTQSWKHEGTTTVVGADLSTLVSPGRRFQLIYQYSRQETDILLEGSIRDTSFGRSRYQWDTTIYRHTSDYALLDLRSGGGTAVGISHRLAVSYEWKLGERVTLSLGGQLELRESATNTSEAVIARRYSRYQSTGSYPYAYFDSTAESKRLLWTFATKLRRVTIPVFLTIRTSETMELLFGLNRSASNWRADDVTLAVIDERVHSDLQGSTRQQNFGERYTQPRERMSEVRTTLMAGLTVSPTPSLSIRFLGVPNYVETFEGTELSDVQLWISVCIRP